MPLAQRIRQWQIVYPALVSKYLKNMLADEKMKLRLPTNMGKYILPKLFRRKNSTA